MTDEIETEGNPWPARLLMVAVVLAVGLLASALGYVLLQNRGRADRNETAVIALCALRLDIDKRIELSQNLLDANPDKKQIAGFDRAVIEMSLTNSRRTRVALNILDC